MTDISFCDFDVVTMHVDDQKYQRNGRNYRRTLLRNSYRKEGKICHDTIANLSKCSDEEINALKFALKNKSLIASKQIPGCDVKTHQGLSVGAVWLLHKMSKRIGIQKALGNSKQAGLALWLVISAVIGCVSRLSAVRLAKSHAACDILNLESFCEDDLYKTLDWLNEQQSQIENKLFGYRYQNRKPNLFLYDVTSSYFEGDKNELAAYGYNRDKKKGKKQVVIGLLTDDEGYPVSCEVFEGNTKDTATFKNQVDKIVNRFGIKKVTFVGDRGMIKSAQIEDLSEEDFFFITAITKPQIEKMLKDGLFQMDLFETQVCEVKHDNVRYVLRRNPIREMEIREVRNGKLMSLKKLCKKKSEYLSKHPRAKVPTATKEINNFAKKLKIDDWVKVNAREREFDIEIDKDKLTEIEKLDGCYAIKSNVSSADASKETIHARYKDLADVEWAFRTMKTTLLHIRGIFVRKENRTRAHVFTSMLAYMLAYELRRLWQDEEITIEEGIEELSSVCATEVIIGGIAIQTVPTPRQMGQQLLAKANVTLPDAIPCREVVVHTRKRLVDERINHLKSAY